MLRPALLSWIYFSLALVGVVWSWFYFMQYFSAADSVMIGPFLKSVMATPASAGVAIDAYIAGIVFSVMAVTRSSTDGVRWPWLYVAMCFLIGLCLALPVYLGMRERMFIKANR